MVKRNKTYYLQDNGSWAEGVGAATDPSFINLISGTFKNQCEKECIKRGSKYIIGAAIGGIGIGLLIGLIIIK